MHGCRNRWFKIKYSIIPLMTPWAERTTRRQCIDLRLNAFAYCRLLDWRS